METLSYLSVGIFITYVLGTCLLFRKIPNSISLTYYLLEEKKKGLGKLFTFFCWAVGFSIIPYMLEYSIEEFQFAAFLAVGGLLFVGSAPLFIEDFEGTVHKSAATICIAASQIWVMAHCWWIFLICWIAYIIGTMIYMKKHKEDTFKRTFLRTKPMFWVEITAFAATYASIFLIL